MTVIHKKNGGYIGVDYKQPFPSGVHVVGGVGRVVDVEVDVELYGGKGANFVAFGTPVGTPGNGGYTKFRVKLDTTKILGIRPSYVNGGAGSGWQGSGGAAAGLTVNTEWLGIAGGGGGVGGRYELTWSGSSTVIAGGNGGSGSGGYGSGSPSAGVTAQGCGPYSDTGTSPYNYLGASSSGAGGGGAPGGANGGSGCYGNWFNPGPTGGGTGGGGNLRIYKDQSVTSGYLSILPDVYMSYTTHTNGSHNGSPQVKLTNVATGASYTYTGSSDIKTVYIKDGVFNP